MVEDKSLATVLASAAMTFFDRLCDRTRATGGVLAVGLNPDLARLPSDCREYDYPRRAFNRRIIDATHEDCAAYVVNPAFYEEPAGWISLAETVAYAHGQGVPVVLDGKWSEAGESHHTDLLDRVDAVTVSPYLGRDALAPVLDRDLGVFVVCRTPNAGAGDLQDRELADGGENITDENIDDEGEDDSGADDRSEDDRDADDDDAETLAERVAALVGEEWSVEHEADVGLLVGGSNETLASLRERAPSLPFLAAGGANNDPEVAEFVTPETDDDSSRDETLGAVGLVEVSREVIYAGETAGRGRVRGQDDYATAARQSARRLKRQLNRHR